MDAVISNETLASLTLELSMLLRAGVSVGDALDMLAQESDYEALLRDMPQWADEGASLSVCFKRSGRFPSYVCGLLEVGERAGRTEEALSALSQYYENRMRLARRIRNALLYPAIMLVLMILVIGVLLVKVLPIFDDVYGSLGGQLTGIAGGLLVIGRWLDRVMPVIWVLLALIVVFFLCFAFVGRFQTKVLALWRGRRGDKGIFRRMNTARMIQALSMGMVSGMPVEEALSLAAELLADVPAAQERCVACAVQMERGESLSAAMAAGGLLTPSATRFLELGQRTGSVDAAMEKLAGDLTEESEAAIEELVGRVEPALVLACSLIVGLILLSVMLPLMHIMSAIG